MTEPLKPTDAHEQAIDDYLARGERHSRARDDAAQTASRVGWARLLVFVGAAVAIAVVVRQPISPAVAWAVGLAGGVIFLVLVRRHRQLTPAVAPYTTHCAEAARQASIGSAASGPPSRP